MPGRLSPRGGDDPVLKPRAVESDNDEAGREEFGRVHTGQHIGRRKIIVRRCPAEMQQQFTVGLRRQSIVANANGCHALRTAFRYYLAAVAQRQPNHFERQ